jgi:hypothetical protein
MSDESVKDAVRARDGYKCRDCGMTNDDHVEQTGKQLEVHRLIPGSYYNKGWCVTLCRECHGKKPRKLEGIIFGNGTGYKHSGVRHVLFNLYTDHGRRIFKALEMETDRMGFKHIDDAIIRILDDYFSRQPLDYCI